VTSQVTRYAATMIPRVTAATRVSFSFTGERIPPGPAAGDVPR
jgi:hypothetical protein